MLLSRYSVLRAPTCALILLLATAGGGGVRAQDLTSPLLGAVSRVPFSVQLGDENLFGPRLGLRVGGSLYPVPLLLQRELNLDAFADLTYTLRASVGGALAGATAALYAGVGPRYRLINSTLFLAGEAPGAFWGVGGTAGAEFRLGALGFPLASAFAEAGSDYIWRQGEAAASGRLSPRVRVGLGLPFVGAF
jgi:hypothetical protein